MIISTLLATATLVQQHPISCPITGEPIVKGMKMTEYNGVSVTYCCASCVAPFEKDPAAALAKAAKDGKTIGVFLFDPISLKRIDTAKAKGGFSDYKGVRFYFDTSAEKTTFDKTPAKFGVLPKKEALFCPAQKAVVTSYGKASGYADHDGTRYYFCCGGCEIPFAADPAKSADIAKDHVKTPAAIAAEKSAAGSGGGF